MVHNHSHSTGPHTLPSQSPSSAHTTAPATTTKRPATLPASTAITISPSTPPANTPLLSNQNTASNTASNPHTSTPTLIFRLSSTTIPLTITSGSSTFTSSFVTLMPENSPTATVGNVAALSSSPICIGKGIDATTIGVLSSLVLSSVVGLLLWLLFAYLRPQFRQVYSVREWFVSPELRPQPLGRSFWAFLSPPVPLVPSVPSDVSSYSSGQHPQVDAKLFPSDEELMQRTLWHAFILVLSWTIIGLGGALPLYLVNTPCLANSTPTGRFGGKYSALQDLSVLRLLAQVRDNNARQFRRAVRVDDADVPQNIEIRLIVLTVLVIALAAVPALFKLLHEYTRLAAHRRRWAEVRCGGLEMGWLSRAKALGFDGWGEGQLKDFIVKTGLSTGFKNSGAPREGFAGVGAYGRSARGESHTSPEGEEKARPEIDLQGLFTIADTTRLAGLIEERDVVLNNLELAETRYINSFKLSTPSPSIIDYEVPEESTEEPEGDANGLKRRISRPRALSGSVKRKQRHSHERAAAPTTYVAPSSYYKLRHVRGVGKMSSDGAEDSLTQRISQRVVGSRFQEIHRDSVAFGRIALGSRVQLDDRTGSFEPVRLSQDQLLHGPNDPSSGNEAEAEDVPRQYDAYPDYADTFDARMSDGVYSPEVGPSTVRDVWTPTVVGSEDVLVRPRPPRQQTPPPPARRSTFAMRPKAERMDEGVQPPHLRLQPQQPFVRPVSGMDHDDLGVVYGDIREWRSRLKSINAEISDAQAEGYNYIADGMHIKGWLLIGRGVRFVPGVQMIEGRSKEDIRYHELQNETGVLSAAAFWVVVAMVGLVLGALLIAVAGLVVSPAPDVAHFLSFLQPLSDTNSIGAALATTLAPAVAASLLIAIALFIVRYAARFTGVVSVSAARITAFKATFLILAVVCCIWLIACGSMIFALEAFAGSSGMTRTLASGSVYMAPFLLVLVIIVATISPALLMLQPLHLLRLMRRERRAVTPRQRFRAIYPRVYDPSYTTAFCLLAVNFSAAFSLIFPLIGPAVCLLLFLTLIAHRFLIGYVYVRTDSGCTSGLLQLWLLRCFANVIALQPLLLGLIFLTRRLWLLGGVLAGAGISTIIIVEGYTRWKIRLPGVGSLSPTTRDSLARFKEAATSEKAGSAPEDGSALRRAVGLPRSSMASVLEMMSLTLAVMPSSSNLRGPVPLPTEDLDDLTATERAARANPNAPPHLPPLHFMTHSEEMQSILYAPELIAPPPVIWLPNDRSGIAQSEAYDLQRWHDLKTTLDVGTDAIPRQSNDLRRRDNSFTS